MLAPNRIKPVPEDTPQASTTPIQKPIRHINCVTQKGDGRAGRDERDAD